jgi:hypothetical protein
MRKKTILVFVFLLLTITGFSQEQPIEKKGAYEANGKVYWNKELPISITLSSPDNTKIELNKPFFLDTEGINFIRTKWEMDSTGKYVYPLQEQLWKVYADSKPPITKPKFIAKESYEFRDKKYYSDDLKVELIATDEISGVKKIYYSINSSDYVLYENYIIFEAGIDVDLKFYAVDNVGNVEDISELSYNYDNNNLNFGIDNEPPITYLINKDLLLSPKDVIKLESEDINGVGVHSTYYKIDSMEFVKFDKPITLNNLSDGLHDITFFSQDWINNREEDVLRKFYLDAIAPDIKINEEIIEDGLTNLRYITLSVTDNKSGVDKVMVQLKKGDKFEEYTKPFYIDIRHQEIKIKAVDGVGNESIRIVKYNEIR